MHNLQTHVISDDSIWRAWARAFVEAGRSKTFPRRPLHLTIRNGAEALDEDQFVRSTLDRWLRALGQKPVRDTAYMIFPETYWRRRPWTDRQAFYSGFQNDLGPRLRSLDRANCFGTYFERMVSFRDDAESLKNPRNNQLEFVIQRLSGDRWFRQTGLQIAIFDPLRDLSKAVRRVFPCLQQLGISRAEDDGFVLNALYPVQGLFERAYGNYLGLFHLGRFISEASGRNFTGLSCFVNSPRFCLGNASDLLQLEVEIESVLSVSRRMSDERSTV